MIRGESLSRRVFFPVAPRQRSDNGALRLFEVPASQKRCRAAVLCARLTTTALFISSLGQRPRKKHPTIITALKATFSLGVEFAGTNALSRALSGES
jgi:hypothetical protein